MVTGEIKNKIDQIWDTFFVAGITNPITVLEQSFLVPVEEIRNNNYDLSINKYKEIEREKVVYDSVETILARLDKSETEYIKGYSQLVSMLEEKTSDGQG